MEAQIQKLLNGQDNVEKIRDRIAFILKTELKNQYELAVKDDLKNAKDFDAKVFLENDRPWEFTESENDKNPFPLVNVCLVETKRAEGKAGSAIGRKKYTASFSIDCYACGNYGQDGRDDELSTIRAWTLARIVRNILMSGFYAYLGMRGVVLERDLSGIKTGSPNDIENSAVAVTIARLDFSVSFYEDSPQGEGVEFEGIDFNLLSKTGEVLVNS